MIKYLLYFFQVFLNHIEKSFNTFLLWFKLSQNYQPNIWKIFLKRHKISISRLKTFYIKYFPRKSAEYFIKIIFWTTLALLSPGVNCWVLQCNHPVSQGNHRKKDPFGFNFWKKNVCTSSLTIREITNECLCKSNDCQCSSHLVWKTLAFQSQFYHNKISDTLEDINDFPSQWADGEGQGTCNCPNTSTPSLETSRTVYDVQAEEEAIYPENTYQIPLYYTLLLFG